MKAEEAALSAPSSFILHPSALAPTAPDDLPFAERLRQDPYGLDFFQTVRRLECEHAHLPRVGHSARPAQDPVRFCQEASLAFAPSNVWRHETRPGKPARLFVNFMGLLGPNGALPLHLTEFIRDRQRNHGDATMARFLDVFNHRMISLFYRAWASSHQTVSYDRFSAKTLRRDGTDDEDDRFAVYIASTLGLGMPPLRGRDAVPDAAKLHFSGHLSCQSRHADGLRAIVRSYFGIDADIEQFIGQWIEVPHDARCRLGESPATGTLGATAIVGSTVWDCQQKFRIRLGPMDWADYQRMLPGGDSLRRLVDWAHNYVGNGLTWDVRLVLKAREVPQIRLGGMGQLGWSTWLTSQPVQHDRDSLVLGPFAA